MNEKISIIVPVYNSEKYLRDCLDSVVNQTYENIEIIIVNDGSKDDSEKICREYEKKDSRIKYFYQENQGVSSARNLGLENMRGDYFIFVDSDDIADLRLLEILYKNLKISETDISICRYLKIDDSTRKNISNLTKDRVIEEDMPWSYSASEAIIKLVEGSKYSGYTWNKLFKKRVITDEGGSLVLKFSQDIHMCEDLLFCVEYLNKIELAAFSDIQLYYYFENLEGITKGGYSERLFTLVDAYEGMLELFKEDLSGYRLSVKDAVLKAFLLAVISHYSMMIKDGFESEKIEAKYKEIISKNYSRTQKKDIGKRDRMLARLIKIFPSSIYRRTYAIYLKFK